MPLWRKLRPGWFLLVLVQPQILSGSCWTMSPLLSSVLLHQRGRLLRVKAQTSVTEFVRESGDTSQLRQSLRNLWKVWVTCDCVYLFFSGKEQSEWCHGCSYTIMTEVDKAKRVWGFDTTKCQFKAWGLPGVFLGKPFFMVLFILHIL